MHKIKVVRSHANGGRLVQFALYDSGMILGMAHNDTAAFGEDPAKCDNRAFIDHESAIAWMKDQCRKYLGRQDVDFEEVDAGRQVIANGGGLMRKM